MKKYVFAFALLICGFISAAVTMSIDDGDIIKKFIKLRVNGKIVEYPIEDVDSIFFEDSLIHIPVIKEVQFSADTIYLEEGGKQQLTYKVLEEGVDQDCDITISNQSVVKYQDYVVTALSEGTAQIIATASDGETADTCEIVVSKKPEPEVTKVELSKHNVELNVNETTELTWVVYPTTYNQDCTFWTNKSNVIEYNKNTHILKAVGIGYVMLVATAADGEHKDTCRVNVVEKVVEVTGISLSASSASMTVGDTKTLTCTVSPANATNKTVTWSTSNSGVATVSNGVITAKSAGSATITAKCGNFSKTCTVTVSNPTVNVTGVTLSSSSLSLEEGETSTLKATVSPSNASNTSVTWSSSDTKVATVNTDGVVSAVSEGSAIITVTTDDQNKKATCTVTVKAPALTPEAVDLGLSVKWASCNYGATTRDSIGTSLNWGAVTTTASAATVDNIVKTSYDVAHVKWGDDWRLPTSSEMMELIENCTWEVVYGTDQKAYYKVSSRENYILIPIPDEKAATYYWCGDKGQTNPFVMTGAEATTESNSIAMLQELLASTPSLVRPVYGKYAIPLQLSLGDKSISSTSATLTINFSGDKDDVKSYGIEYSTDEKFSNPNTKAGTLSIATVNTVSVTLTGLSKGVTYYYRAYAKQSENTVYSNPGSFKTTNDVADMIDLGLPTGVKWADFNLGNDSPISLTTEKYYLWGDPDGDKSAQSFNYPTSTDISGTSYDIAKKKWGSEWRIPTKDDFNDLLKYCTCTRVTKSGVFGLLVEAKAPLDAHIFLPAAGNKQNTGAYYKVGDVGFYWTGTMNPTADSEAYYFTVQAEYGIKSGYKRTSMSIRPVFGERKDESGSGEGYEKSSEGVDLGLGSIRWAKFNVGTTKPEASGDYISWGEINAKTSYSDAAYTLMDPDDATGYLNPGRDIRGTEYDAARQRWGGKWRLPSQAEMQELINYCDWTWTSINGVSGYKVSGRGSYSSNYIFLPAAGYKNSNGLQFNGTKGYYQTATNFIKSGHMDNNKMNYGLELNSSEKYVYADYKNIGRCIRPVYDTSEK